MPSSSPDSNRFQPFCARSLVGAGHAARSAGTLANCGIRRGGTSRSHPCRSLRCSRISPNWDGPRRTARSIGTSIRSQAQGSSSFWADVPYLDPAPAITKLSGSSIVISTGCRSRPSAVADRDAVSTRHDRPAPGLDGGKSTPSGDQLGEHVEIALRTISWTWGLHFLLGRGRWRRSPVARGLADRFGSPAHSRRAQSDRSISAPTLI